MAASNIFTQLAAQNTQGGQTGQTAMPAQANAAPQEQPPTSQPSNIFTQLAAQNTQQGSGQQSDPNQQPQQVSISAVPDGSLADKAKNWATNVSNDITHGTDITGVGHVLKAMGAHGVYNGNSQAVGDFMASLPLGLLKAAKGGAETTQGGQRWQGVKDLAGGTLQASTIPGGFIAPEAGEAGAEQATRAAKAVSSAASKPFDVQSIQPALQQGVRNVLNTVAKDAGVTPSPAASIRDVAGQVADAVLAKSKGLYTQLDSATGGQFQRFDDSLRNINQKLRETAGLDDENEASLLKRKADVEQAQQAAFDQAKAAGVDPNLVDQARQSYKQAQALYDLDTQFKMSTSGMRPELASPGSSPELVDPKKAFARLNKLYDSGRLQQAVGQTNSERLIQHADTAFLHQAKIAGRIQALKTGAKITGTGAAIGTLGAGTKLAKNSLSGHQ